MPDSAEAPVLTGGVGTSPSVPPPQAGAICVHGARKALS
jgi:hypothetical protein